MMVLAVPREVDYEIAENRSFKLFGVVEASLLSLVVCGVASGVLTSGDMWQLPRNLSWNNFNLGSVPSRMDVS